MTYREGDQVTWTSQAVKGTRTKTGVVVAVVPPGRWPSDALRLVGISGRIVGPAPWPRDHESYVVRADGRLYYPLTSLLSLRAR